jgi:hypothetical protein
METTAVASKGPIIQGKGVRSAMHSEAAAQANNKVTTMRAGSDWTAR